MGTLTSALSVGPCVWPRAPTLGSSRVVKKTRGKMHCARSPRSPKYLHPNALALTYDPGVATVTATKGILMPKELEREEAKEDVAEEVVNEKAADEDTAELAGDEETSDEAVNIGPKNDRFLNIRAFWGPIFTPK